MWGVWGGTRLGLLQDCVRQLSAENQKTKQKTNRVPPSPMHNLFVRCCLFRSVRLEAHSHCIGLALACIQACVEGLFQTASHTFRSQIRATFNCTAWGEGVGSVKI